MTVWMINSNYILIIICFLCSLINKIKRLSFLILNFFWFFKFLRSLMNLLFFKEVAKFVWDWRYCWLLVKLFLMIFRVLMIILDTIIHRHKFMMLLVYINVAYCTLFYQAGTQASDYFITYALHWIRLLKLNILEWSPKTIYKTSQKS